MHPVAGTLALLLLLAPAAPGAGGARQPTRDEGGEIDVSDFPPREKARYAVFRQKCGSCHSLARAMSGQLDPAALRRHVARMKRRPGTALTDEDARSILAFFEYYASRSERR